MFEVSDDNAKSRAQVGCLYANGCSMTYGYELIDHPETHVCLDHIYRETYAWPGRLAARLNCNHVVNDSTPGGSNDRILRTTIRWVTQYLASEGELGRQSLLVVIGWSDPMRREFYIDGAWKQVIPYHDYPEHPALNRFNAIYRTVAWNDHESACRFATQVLALQTFLQYHGVRFLFFDALKSCQETFSAARIDVTHVGAVDTRTYLNFTDCGGSMASILSTATPNWKGRHPAEDGHDYWAELLADHLRCYALLVPSLPLLAPKYWFQRWWRKIRRRTAGDRGPFVYP